ncbi:unnamed protein product [Cuscuta epithymum]|uniref:Uncharacterized protein n=1 Tax=Cuscuta epithymum TaxID=186058 RepID=A0AAV0CB28_9ASTE|nr:unnamed protein product [Cuscuta epithymum]
MRIVVTRRIINQITGTILFWGSKDHHIYISGPCWLPSIFRSYFKSKPLPQIQSQKNVLTHLQSDPRLTLYDHNQEISSLGRRGKVDEARKVFDEMPHRDVVSYASMISIYVKNKELVKAENLYFSIPERNVVSESAMLDGYAKAGRMEEARQIFDGMPNRNVYSWTSLVSGYFQIGNVDEARRLFEQMPEKSAVSWTVALTGFARNGQIDEARSNFDEMPCKNVIAWTAMIRAYIENCQVDRALELFNIMPARNLHSWNIMIQGCLDYNMVDVAVELFNRMPRRNEVSWTTMVTGLAHNRLTDLARMYFDQMPYKDVAAWNAMITVYCAEGLMDKASELFEFMPNKNLISWNMMIDGYAKSGPEGEALKLFQSMLRYGLRPDQTTITSVLTSCRSCLELLQVHPLSLLLGLEHETSLTNALITMYSRNGDLTSSMISFENLKMKDIVSWTAMILAYAYHGLANQAFQTFARMLKSGKKPDDITFVGVLSACSHAGLVTKGQKIFDAMVHAYGLKPRAEHYCCLVDILGRAQLLDKAVLVVAHIPPEELDGAVLGALLGACKLYGDAALARQIGDKLIELEPGSSGGYVLLANAYAASGNWDSFAQVRKKMKQREVKKVPGFSQIEVNGKCHVFCVGDRSHPEMSEIYKVLQEKLQPLMQETFLLSRVQDPIFSDVIVSTSSVKDLEINVEVVH